MYFSRKLFIFSLIVFPLISYGLEIDDKLTLRVLNTSQSKKTVLVNRGIEDGLAQGDHAKFFLTIGVVARGTVVKVSPTRSVWSLYRLVNPDYIKKDIVMNLKISDAVKITDDKTKMIVNEPEIMGSDTIGIPLAAGARDIDQKMNAADQAELRALRSRALVMIPDRNIEIIGMLAMSSLGSTTVADSESIEQRSGSDTSMDLLLGAEFYFNETQAWYKSLSLMPFYRVSTLETMSSQGTSINGTVTEYGVNFAYHIFSEHYETMSPIYALNVGFGAGSAVNTLVVNSSTGSGSAEEKLAGSVGFFQAGLGAKFYLSSGWGVRFNIDYFNRTIAYDADTNNNTWEVTQSGTRIYAGFAYRF